jgi:hypothetical protein
LCVGDVLVVKVDTIIFCTDLKDLLVGVVLQDKLLDQVKGFLVLSVLSDLDNCAPCVRSELFFAVVTLHVQLSELGNEGLFHFGVVVELLFDGDFDLDSFGVAFGPDETCVDYFCLVESLDFFEEEGQELFTVPVAGDPWGSHVPVTEPAEVNDGFLGDADGDIGLGDGTGWTDVTNGGDELYTTHGTENGDVSLALDFHICEDGLIIK